MIKFIEHETVDLEVWYPLLAESEREFKQSVLDEPKYMWNYLNDNNMVTFVEAKENDKTVGVCIFVEYLEGEPELQALYVMPEHQGNGVATAIIEHCLEQRGKMQIFTRQPEIHHICKKLGFNEIGTQTGHYSGIQETIYEKKTWDV